MPEPERSIEELVEEALVEAHNNGVDDSEGPMGPPAHTARIALERAVARLREERDAARGFLRAAGVTVSLPSPYVVAHLVRSDCQIEEPHDIARCGAFALTPKGGGRDG